jgi:P27 family predicted phage terminase small subunit
MALRGRKPSPTPLKILRGTKPSRIPRDEPRAPAGRPKPPKHLDRVARAEWKRIVPILEEMGVLTQADGAELALYCEDFALLRQAEADVVEHGIIVEAGTGGWKTNPAVYIAAGCRMRLARYLAEFGCTPSSRSRVKMQGEEKKDALGEFLARKGRA